MMTNRTDEEIQWRQLAHDFIEANIGMLDHGFMLSSKDLRTILSAISCGDNNDRKQAHLKKFRPGWA